jgi:ATP-binding cassette subfamily B protein
LLKFLKNGFILLLSLVRKADRKNLRRSVAAEFLSVLAGVFPIFALYEIVKALASGRATMKAMPWAIAAFAAILLKTLFHGAATRLSHQVAFDTLYAIRVRLVEKLARLPMGYLVKMPSGKVKSMVFDDVETLEQFYAHHVPDILGGLGVPALMLFLALILDVRIGLAMILPLALYFWTVNRMNQKQRRNFPGFFRASKNLNARLTEYITGMKEIRIFAGEEKSYGRLGEAAGAYQRFTLNWFRECWPEMALSAALVGTVAAFVFPAAGSLYLSGEATLPELILYLFIALGIGQPMVKITQYFDILSLNIQAAEGIQSVLNLPELTATPSGRRPAGHAIRFEHVRFAYGDRDVLTDVSFTAPEGKVTALVGESGGGKSTVARLIARFWDVKEGAVTIGGADIRELPIEELNGLVSYVTQNATLFEMSIAENIRLGKPGASMEAVAAAADAAQLGDFVRALPKGYDTVVGAGGVRLSGGEGQRVAVARAILKNAPILLLDEATAFADAENEDKMQKALAHLAKGRTVVLIAHRLNTVRNADNILLMQKGEIIAQGTHRALLENPVYRRMWAAYERVQSWRAGEEVSV